MRTAIAEVMPTTTHRLCGWHLEKNCVQRVKEVEFCKVFRNAIYANFEIREFEEYWKASMESLGLDDNNWVKSTYECRASWAMGHLRGTFCAGYKTTSRCEGINAFIKGFLKSTDSILELVHSLDRVIKDYQNNEVTAQFYSTYYSPVLTTGIDSIERFASKLYTRAVFREISVWRCFVASEPLLSYCLHPIMHAPFHGKLYVGGSPLSMATIRPLSENGPATDLPILFHTVTAPNIREFEARHSHPVPDPTQNITDNV
ncbi:hypothetical protein AHAS_Ahas04G0120200 [Arachis hypogaea]